MEYKIQASIIVNKNIEEIEKKIVSLICNINGKTIEIQSDSILWIYKYVFQTIRCKTYLVSHEKNTEIVIMVDSDYINLSGSKKIINDLKKELSLDSKTKILSPTSKDFQKSSSQKNEVEFIPPTTKNKTKYHNPTSEPISTKKFFESNFAIIGILIVFIISILSMIVDSSNTSDSNQKIQNSSWDGSVVQVEIYLKHNLNDPDSYQSISWGKVVELNDNKFVVRHKYRAKNSFGGYVVEDKLFAVDSLGSVIDFRDVR